MGGAQETIQSINNLQLENDNPTSLTLSKRGEAEKSGINNEQISNLEVYNPNKVCLKYIPCHGFNLHVTLQLTLHVHLIFV